MAQKNNFDNILRQIINEKAKSIKGELDKSLEKINAVFKKTKSIIETELSDSELSKIESDLETQIMIPPEKGLNLEVLYKKIKVVSDAGTQSSIIDAMMDGLEFLTERSYFLVKKGTNIVCFRSTGISSNPKQLIIPYSADTSVKHVIDSGEIYFGSVNKFPEENIILNKIEKPKPSEIFVLPIKIKGKTMASIYIDNKGKKIENRDAIKIFSHVTSMSLDLLPIKKWVTESLEKGKAKKPQKTEVKLSPEEKKSHDKAKRLSKVIVSDIIAYNKDAIKKGEEQGNIYKYLKNEIDQAAAHFYNKVNENIWKQKNYFEEKLIEKIAKGDKDLLDGFNFRTE